MKTKIIAALLATAFSTASYAARIASEGADLSSWESVVPTEIQKCAQAGGKYLKSDHEGVACTGAVTWEFPAPKNFERWVYAFYNSGKLLNQNETKLLKESDPFDKDVTEAVEKEFEEYLKRMKDMPSAQTLAWHIKKLANAYVNRDESQEARLRYMRMWVDARDANEKSKREQVAKRLCGLREAGAQQLISFGREQKANVVLYSFSACAIDVRPTDKVKVDIYTTAAEPEKLSEADMENKDAERDVMDAIKRCADAGGFELKLKHDGNTIKSFCSATIFSYPPESTQRTLFEVLRNDTEKIEKLCSLSENVRSIRFRNESMGIDRLLERECRDNGVRVILTPSWPNKK